MIQIKLRSTFGEQALSWTHPLQAQLEYKDQPRLAHSSVEALLLASNYLDQALLRGLFLQTTTPGRFETVTFHALSGYKTHLISYTNKLKFQLLSWAKSYLSWGLK